MVSTPVRFEMYSTAGDAACAAACASIAEAAEDHTRVWNTATLLDVARPLIAAVASEHPEVFDTEPRAEIADFLAAVCAAHGWSHDGLLAYQLG